MTAALSYDLRTHVDQTIEGREIQREAARIFDVWVASAVCWQLIWRKTAAWTKEALKRRNRDRKTRAGLQLLQSLRITPKHSIKGFNSNRSKLFAKDLTINALASRRRQSGQAANCYAAC